MLLTFLSEEIGGDIWTYCITGVLEYLGMQFYLGMLLISFVVSMVGFVPFIGLRMRHKFLLQWVVGLTAAAILYWGLKIDFVYIPFFGIWRLGLAYLPLAAFLIVGFANAFDITDGLDGLSGGLLLICLMAFWVIALAGLDQVLATFIAVWIGALAAFLYFNIYPARIMLGNMGGLAFGATLAVVGLLSGRMIAMLIIGGGVF